MSPPEPVQPNASGPPKAVETRGEILRSLKPAAFAVIILGVLGLGGSLLIATVGFNSPASSTHVAGPVPEILYQPPGTTLPTIAETQKSIEAPLAGMILARPSENPQDASIERAGATLQPPTLRLAMAPAPEALAWTNPPMTSYTGQFLAPGSSITAPSETGFEAISNAAVPEPSTVTLLVGALVALAGFSRWRRRRPAIRA